MIFSWKDNVKECFRSDGLSYVATIVKVCDDKSGFVGGFSFGDMECTDDTIDEFNKLLHWKESYQSTNSVNLCGHDTILSVLKLLFDCLNCCTVKEHQKYFNWQWILSILLSYLHLAGKMDYSLDCCSHLK